ncbi:Gfo/Idh/MocA family protein [Actinocrispum wychmicini]|uniref:Putative dehydrogenase n=1 Tax=Actinocrispum wychmicini TaxID=1213861 RepID=A0A4R2JGH8_9PSEU|nr:Gfo/Idh/MocA family oxidoreductase [Actinocrispum wychmicini]TCO58134.1 putative dehydrogenase [Actinocrispum wychmicini]
MIGWGVVATGGIADVVTSDMKLVDGTEVRAVSSRDPRKAADFAERHGIPRSYGNNDELIADPSVDVVYVATPHSSHYEVAKAALVAGKAVLCEKPLTVTLAAAEELVALARQQGAFLMEAMWTRFNPLVRKLRQWVAEGVIGQIRGIHADFGALFPADPTHRGWNPLLGGGSLLDLGVYPVSLVQMLLGEPTAVVTHGLVRNEVDAQAAMLLRYPDGVSAQVTSSMISDHPVRATIVGTNGRIELSPDFFRVEEMVVQVGADRRVERVELTGHGYTYQIAEVNARVLAGDKESPEMTLDDTLAVMRILTTGLTQLGVRYPDTVR